MSPQRFVATYTINPPTVQKQRTNLHAVRADGITQVRIDRRMADLCSEYGIPIVETTEQVTEVDPAFMDRLIAAYPWGMDGINAAPPDATVSTPTSDGVAAHTERRLRFEKWLRANGCTYTVVCATQHSDLVCQMKVQP